MNFSTLATREQIEKTMAALKANGMEAFFVETGEEAGEKALALIPKGAEVMDMTSETLRALGLDKIIQESGDYKSVRKMLVSMDRKTQGLEMNKLGAASEYVIGSVHAVTENGEVMIASNTGSQLPAYAYGASHVIWVVGAQKIVSDLDLGRKRIYEHSLPLESERAKKAYGAPGSSVNKILTVNKEVQAGRINLIFVNQVLGF